jgi:hypothetical protein
VKHTTFGSTIQKWRLTTAVGRKYVLLPRWLLDRRGPLSDNALRLLVQVKHWGTYDKRTHTLTPFERTNQQWAWACGLSVRAVQYAKREIEELYK